MLNDDENDLTGDLRTEVRGYIVRGLFDFAPAPPIFVEGMPDRSCSNDPRSWHRLQRYLLANHPRSIL